jgi:hypothetical protein
LRSHRKGQDQHSGVFVVGSELTLFTAGIVSGRNIVARMRTHQREPSGQDEVAGEIGSPHADLCRVISRAILAAQPLPPRSVRHVD